MTGRRAGASSVPPLAFVLASLVGAPAAGAAGGDLTAQSCIADAGSLECAVRQNGLDLPRGLAVSDDGRSVYAAAAKDNAVTRLIRDPLTGTIQRGGCVADPAAPVCARTTPGLAGANGVAVSGDGRSVYVVSARGIVNFARAPSTGAIRPVQCFGPPACSNPLPGLVRAADAAVSADGRSVYVVASASDAIVRFDRDARGVLTPRGCIQDDATTGPVCDALAPGLDGAIALAVSPDDGAVLVAASDDHAITGFDRAADGALAFSECVSDDDSGNPACAQRMPGLLVPLSVALSADGGSVYGAAHVDNAIAALDRDPATNALSPHGCVEGAGGFDECTPIANGPVNPTALTVSGDGTSVYAASGGSDAILHLARAADGTLTSASCIEDDRAPVATACGQAFPGLNGPGALAASADDLSLYSGSRDDAVVAFTRAAPTP